MILRKKQLNSDLKILVGCISILIIIGLLFIYSSSSVFALEKFGSPHYFVKKQIIGLFIGLVGLGIACAFPLALLQRLTPLLFFGSLGLTALTMVPQISQRIHGSSRWLTLAGITFQPSEFLKISFLLYLAYFLTKKGRSSSGARTFIPFLIILGITSIILLKQPDFGLTVTIAATAFIVLFIAQCDMKYLLYSSMAILPVGIILVVLKPYRLQRIITFLDPWADPKGAGFQIIQSLIAIGSGGFWGVGIGQSKQKFFYLPMQCTDFIFSIIAEETGFVGSCLLISVFIAFSYVGMRIAKNMHNAFYRFTILGFIILTTLQAIINLAVTTGLAPTKGIGLPFISYGNTSLISNLCMVGLLINMVRNDN